MGNWDKLYDNNSASRVLIKHSCSLWRSKSYVPTLKWIRSALAYRPSLRNMSVMVSCVSAYSLPATRARSLRSHHCVALCQLSFLRPNEKHPVDHVTSSELASVNARETKNQITRNQCRTTVGRHPTSDRPHPRIMASCATSQRTTCRPSSRHIKRNDEKNPGTVAPEQGS